MHDSRVTRIHTIVIGGGQAGLSVGYYLKQRGIPFLILDAHPRIGDAWRNRWDSLRLFTAPRYSGLPGLPLLPTKYKGAPNKDEMANYLESYARIMRLPVHCDARVESVTREGSRFLVVTKFERYEAENVVVAMANYQVPKVPGFADDLSSEIRQFHSNSYKNPSQLKPGSVLVVGAGNSGGDIALELARTHRVSMSGKESGVIPFPIDSFLARHIFSRVFRFVAHHVLTLDTPIGRRAYPKLLHRPAPLVRVKPKDLVAAGVERVPRVVGVHEGLPVLQDGRTLKVDNVVWCTGFQPGFNWVKLPIFGQEGLPQHNRGVVAEAPGLYFVGLQFQYAFSSSTLMGVARDAEFIVNQLGTRKENPFVLSTVRTANSSDVRATAV